MNYIESIISYSLLEDSWKDKKIMNEMERFFIERTRKHISYVNDFLDIACEYYPHIAEDLRKRGSNHDLSKFYHPERKWYILLTWRYKCINEGNDFKLSEEDDREIRNISFYHCKNNSHHPEFWDKNLEANPIDKNNREKRNFMTDASNMSVPAIIEMVSDWSAMSREKNKNSPRKWAEESINKRWKFTKQQQELIYDTIDLLWT